MALWNIVVCTTGKTVVACGANLTQRADNDTAHFAVVILAPFADLLGKSDETVIPLQLCGRGNLHSNVAASLKSGCAHFRLQPSVQLPWGKFPPRESLPTLPQTR